MMINKKVGEKTTRRGRRGFPQRFPARSAVKLLHNYVDSKRGASLLSSFFLLPFRYAIFLGVTTTALIGLRAIGGRRESGELMTTVKEGDTITLHYKGSLDDGTVFDSSEGR